MRGAVRTTAVLAVLLGGVLTLAASGNSDDKTPVKGGEKNPAAADVSITNCAVSSNEFMGPSATLSVVNNSSKASNYLITIAFESPDGATQLDTGNASVQNLAPGQTASADAPSLKSELRGTPFICKVADVTRLSASG